MVEGIPCQGCEALKALFPVAELERWGGGWLGERQAVLALLTRAWTLNPLLMAAASPP